MSELKVTVLIPTRGDRPQFLEQAHYLLERQTHEDFDIRVIKSTKGITGNYRAGFKSIKEGIIICIEDDDFYPINYIQTIIDNWDDRYDLLGFDQTVYYHLGQRAYRIIPHPGRASMFSTVIKAGIDINWPDDSEKALDIKLWSDPHLQKKLIQGSLAVGIKHGIGMCGGSAHGTLFPYDHEDEDLSYLSAVTRNDKFYINLSRKL